MEWSIQELARTAGTTSRTLRHYGDLGLLVPSRVAGNGYRYYDQDAVLRLQRILLLRELGLGLAAIAEVLAGRQDRAAALHVHLELLERERQRVERQIASVRTTLRKMEGGEQIMAAEALDGFDHTQYEQEVTERWGADAYRRSDRWWRSLSAAEKEAFQAEQRAVQADFAAALRDGEPADGDRVQAITQRLHQWLSQATDVTKEYFVGLGDLYVDDPRFTRSFDQHQPGTAVLVRDAMRVYAERDLATA